MHVKTKNTFMCKRRIQSIPLWPVQSHALLRYAFLVPSQSTSYHTVMPGILDDKSEHCVPFILEHIKAHHQHYASKGEKAPPFFVGLNGVQGAGKTTLVGY